MALCSVLFVCVLLDKSESARNEVENLIEIYYDLIKFYNHQPRNKKPGQT